MLPHPGFMIRRKKEDASRSMSETIGRGYWRAVVAATLTLVCFKFLESDFGRHGFHEYVVMGPVMFVVVAFVMYVTALLPFLAVRWVAKVLAIRNVWYYVVCGALVGTALCILAIAVLPYPAYDEPIAPSFAEQFATGAPIFAFSGAIGALVYWWKTGRHFGQARASGASAPLGT
jgi:hypothetical protein